MLFAPRHAPCVYIPDRCAVFDWLIPVVPSVHSVTSAVASRKSIHLSQPNPFVAVLLKVTAAGITWNLYSHDWVQKVEISDFSRHCWTCHHEEHTTKVWGVLFSFKIIQKSLKIGQWRWWDPAQPPKVLFFNIVKLFGWTFETDFFFFSFLGIRMGVGWSLSSFLLVRASYRNHFLQLMGSWGRGGVDDFFFCMQKFLAINSGLVNLDL